MSSPEALLFGLDDFKGNSVDIVSPWIDNLLIEKDFTDDAFDGSAVILPYPVERVLTNESGFDPHKTVQLKVVEKSIVSAPLVKIDPEAEVPYFLFASGSSFYAIDIKHVVEILKYQEPINIFSKKPELIGVISYRSKIVTIYNSSRLLSSFMDAKNIFKSIVMLSYSGKLFGIAVNDIKGMTRVKNKNIIPSRTFKIWNSNNLTSDVFEDDSGRFFSIMDIKNLFNYLKS